MHNAVDQIRGEACSQQFFSKGQFSNPMVVRIASLAYQKGFGGHFHNANAIASIRDIPGLLIACPSNGRDAVLMLRTCVAAAHECKLVSVFLEPIALYDFAPSPIISMVIKPTGNTTNQTIFDNSSFSLKLFKSTPKS